MDRGRYPLLGAGAAVAVMTLLPTAKVIALS
jgi:hypothetical protein